MLIVNLYQSNLYFFYFFYFTRYLGSWKFYLNFKFIIIKIIITVILQSLLSNTCDLFSRIFEVFNEMEIEINVINNKLFTKLYLNKSKRKRNSIIYHFLVKSKPHQTTQLLITASVNIYQTKKSIPIVMKPCFS